MTQMMMEEQLGLHKSLHLAIVLILNMIFTIKTGIRMIKGMYKSFNINDMLDFKHKYLINYICLIF